MEVEIIMFEAPSQRIRKCEHELQAYQYVMPGSHLKRTYLNSRISDCAWRDTVHMQLRRHSLPSANLLAAFCVTCLCRALSYIDVLCVTITIFLNGVIVWRRGCKGYCGRARHGAGCGAEHGTSRGSEVFSLLCNDRLNRSAYLAGDPKRKG